MSSEFGKSLSLAREAFSLARVSVCACVCFDCCFFDAVVARDTEADEELGRRDRFWRSPAWLGSTGRAVVGDDDAREECRKTVAARGIQQWHFLGCLETRARLPTPCVNGRFSLLRSCFSCARARHAIVLNARLRFLTCLSCFPLQALSLPSQPLFLSLVNLARLRLAVPSADAHAW